MKKEYKAPGHSSTIGQSSNMGSGDSAGVEAGLSARSEFDSEGNGELNVNQSASVSGNPRQCIGKREATSVSKFGKSFDLGA